jgi:hypothetical protein
MLGLGCHRLCGGALFLRDTVSVYADDSHKAGTRVGTGITLATDTFGGSSAFATACAEAPARARTTFTIRPCRSNYRVIRNCYDATHLTAPAD